MNQDELYMRAALAEGHKGLGKASPNPAVGAVIARDGKIIGTGWHQRAGEAHAERRALQDAVKHYSPDATRGATLYVTLEPCSTHGRTPPCTDAILEAGIQRVVVSTTDPNPNHQGRGLEILRQNGVEVCTGVLEKEGRDLIRFFAKHVLSGQPWVIAKTAITLDGRTTLGEGMDRWISCPESREDVQSWRHQCDAVLIGGETFRRDDPALTLRGKWAEDREQPWRVVLTSDHLLPQGHQMLQDSWRDRTLIFQDQTLHEALSALGRMGVISVMLESGGRLFTHALTNQLLDEVLLYIAPILGGGNTRLISADGLISHLEDLECVSIGTDLRIRGRISHSLIRASQ